MTATHHDHFRLTDPDVVSLNASREESQDPHVNWFVGYAPEREAEFDARVIMGSLHVVGETGRGDIRVAGLLFDNADAQYDDESLPEVLANSDAVETLYDFARVSLRSVLAIVDADARIPDASPDPEIDQLVRRADAAEQAPDPQANDIL